MNYGFKKTQLHVCWTPEWSWSGSNKTCTSVGLIPETRINQAFKASMNNSFCLINSFFSVLMVLLSSLMANKASAAAVWMAAMSLKRLRRPSRAALPHRLSPRTSDLIELSSLGQSNTVSKWQDTEEDHLWQQLHVNPAPLASLPVPHQIDWPLSIKLPFAKRR